MDEGAHLHEAAVAVAGLPSRDALEGPSKLGDYTRERVLANVHHLSPHVSPRIHNYIS